MDIVSLYTLSQVQQITGANPNLITYLIRDRQIPYRSIGKAKVLDNDGLRQIRRAIAEYEAKPRTATCMQ